jgi:MauM/NapG family ferredoxin protein
MNRRGFVGSFGGVLAGLALGLKARVARAAVRWLRPPGALSLGEFERACIRCFRCAEVCQVNAIRFDATTDLRGSDTPYVVARERACVLCMKCTEACPTGALAKISPTADVVQHAVKMGTPVLTRSRCIPWRGEGVCRLCFYVCPYPGSAVALAGPQQAPLFDAAACVGCGLCEEACPEQARAIRIEPLGARVNR